MRRGLTILTAGKAPAERAALAAEGARSGRGQAVMVARVGLVPIRTSLNGCLAGFRSRLPTEIKRIGDVEA